MIRCSIRSSTLQHRYNRRLFVYGPEQEHWKGVRTLLTPLVADEVMRGVSRGWEARKGREYILHHDPDHDFLVGALVRLPNHVAGVHDHGPTWTIYGVLDGQEITHVYNRLDDGSKPGYAEIELAGKSDAPAGHVDMVPPHVPHAEWGNSDRSVAITVRSQRPGGYSQNRFDLEAGTTNDAHCGLELIPTAV